MSGICKFLSRRGGGGGKERMERGKKGMKGGGRGREVRKRNEKKKSNHILLKTFLWLLLSFKLRPSCFLWLLEPSQTCLLLSAISNPTTMFLRTYYGSARLPLFFKQIEPVLTWPLNQECSLPRRCFFLPHPDLPCTLWMDLWRKLGLHFLSTCSAPGSWVRAQEDCICQNITQQLPPDVE